MKTAPGCYAHSRVRGRRGGAFRTKKERPTARARARKERAREHEARKHAEGLNGQRERVDSKKSRAKDTGKEDGGRDMLAESETLRESCARM